MQQPLTICSICLEAYTNTRPPYEITICQHLFHDVCIIEWNSECGQQQKKALCPQCRQEFNPSHVKIRGDVLSMILKNLLEINLKVVLPDQKVIEIQISSSKMIGSLFSIIELYSDIPKEDFKLQFDGHIYSFLKDEKRYIYDTEITEGSICQLLLEKKDFQVSIKDLNGGSIFLQVNSKMTILKFCQLAEQLTGIPKEQTRYTVAGKGFTLPSSQTLGDFNVQPNQTIFQLARLKGGN